MSKENILIGDAYFEANPNHVLGDTYEKARGDRGGKIEHMVKGTLQSAIEKFNALDFTPTIKKAIKAIDFSVWNNKSNEIKINDFVGCDFIPTKIGFVSNIIKNGSQTEYEISTLFRLNNELKIHKHILFKKYLNILSYDKVPQHISESYNRHINNDENKTTQSTMNIKELAKASPNIIIATMPKVAKSAVVENVIAKSETDRKKAVVTATAIVNSNGAIANTLMYSAAENYDKLNPSINDEELSAFLYANPQSHIWNFKKTTISEQECFKKGLLMIEVPEVWNPNKLKSVYVHEYLTGNVFKKMANVQNAIIKNFTKEEDNKNPYFTESQLEYQLATMQAILPMNRRVDDLNVDNRIVFLPHCEIAKNFLVYTLKNGNTTSNGISLYNLYSNYVNRNLRASQITNGASLEYIRKYVDNKRISVSKEDGEDGKTLKVQMQQRAKKMADELFYSYIEQYISSEDIAKINYLWNSKYNGEVEPNLAKIPVSFPFSKVFKGGSELSLTTTQRNGVAFSQTNGSCLLGYDVGVGKTLTLIACLSNQFTTGATKRALLVVPDATYKKWIYEIKGGKDKHGKWVYGALPSANVFDFGNLNQGKIENDVKEYSDDEKKDIANIKKLLAKAKVIDKEIKSVTLVFSTKLKEIDAFFSEIENSKALTAYVKGLVRENGNSIIPFLNKENASTLFENLIKGLSQDLEIFISTGGKVKDIPEGSIVMLNYTGLKRLGFSQGSILKLQDSLYKVLTQGEDDRKAVATMTKSIEGIIGKVGINEKLTIDELKIDHLAIDEAHNMKNIFAGVKGNQSESGDKRKDGSISREPSRYALKGSVSDQGIAAFCMSQYVQANGGNNTMLTATPFTNNPLEVFSMLMLSDERKLKADGKDNLNEFFDNYIKEEEQLIINADGSASYKAIITGFNNLPQLRSMIFSIIDYKTGEDANVTRPEAISIPDVSAGRKYNGATSILEMNALQKAYMKKIERYLDDKDQTVYTVCADAIESDETSLIVKAYIKNFENAKSDLDNEEDSTKILRALSWQRMLAISPYMFACNDLPFPNYKDFVEDSPKILYAIKCIESSKKYHEDRKQVVSGSVIYMSLGNAFFTLIKEYLINVSGFAKHEVEIIDSSITPAAKERVKEDFLEGKVKVIIGSSTIKEGIDLQNNSSALYVICPDWNPTDYNQVKGRIYRQGNRFSFVRIVNVLMANTADVFIYQKLQEKTQRIKELLDRSSAKSQLDLDDVNPEEIKEALISNPNKLVSIKTMRMSREIDAQIILIDNKVKILSELQQATTVFNNLHPKIVNSVNEFNTKYAVLLKEEDLQADQERKSSHEAKGIATPFESKFDANSELYKPVIFDVNDYSDTNMASISRRSTSMLQRVRENKVFVNGFAYTVLSELVTNWREVRSRFIKGIETLASMGFNDSQLAEAIAKNQEEIGELKKKKELLNNEEQIKSMIELATTEIANRENGGNTVMDCVSQFAALNKYLDFASELKKVEKEEETSAVEVVNEEPKAKEDNTERYIKPDAFAKIVVSKGSKVKENPPQIKSSISEVTKIKFKIETLQETLEDKTITKELKRKVEFKLETLLEYLEEMKEVA